MEGQLVASGSGMMAPPGVIPDSAQQVAVQAPAIMQGPGEMIQGPMVSLAMLLNHAVKRTYTDLLILSELLPSKTDMERKIEIVKWAKTTRMMFVRLLALVKWAASSTKVDRCMQIMQVLEQQSFMFSNTADDFARFWANDLANARLPAFSVYTAIDVLVNKTYNLPTCMRDTIVPAEPIGAVDRKQTMDRLNQIILYRLVTSDIPKAFEQPKIRNGRVFFKVDHEFEVTLTLMSDHLQTPWRLLTTKFLVADAGVGDNKPLLHPTQAQMMHHYLQNHLLDSDRPLVELYHDIHNFCLSLQLEVLYSQLHKLIRTQVQDYVRIEDYVVGRHLLLCYWRYTSKIEDRRETTSVMRLRVRVDEHDLCRPLRVEHDPPLDEDASPKLATLSGDGLSMERLLTQTVMYRCRLKLQTLKEAIRKYNAGPIEISGVPEALYVSVLEPCAPCEQLVLHLDMLTGTVYPACPIVGDLPKVFEKNLNSDVNAVRGDLQKLRHELIVRRCNNSVQHLGLSCTSVIPLHPGYLPSSTPSQPHIRSALSQLQPPLAFIKLKRGPGNTYLVVETGHNQSDCVNPTYKYYILDCTDLKPVTADKADESQNLLFKPRELFRINPSEMLRGNVHFSSSNEKLGDASSRKRKVTDDYTSSKRQHVSPDIISELCSLPAYVEERICLTALKNELKRQGVRTQAITPDVGNCGFVMEVLRLPGCAGCSAEASQALQKLLLAARFRLLTKFSNGFFVEILFRRPRLPTREAGDEDGVHRVLCRVGAPTPGRMSRIVSDFLEDWVSLGRMFQPVHALIKAFNDPNQNIRNQISVELFSFQKLVISYGDQRAFTLSLTWRSSEKQYLLTVGTMSSEVTNNPHQIISAQINTEFNANPDLLDLCTALSDTLRPLEAISRLNTSLVYDMAKTDIKLPVQNFTILPQSSRHIRLLYRSLYCLDVTITSGSQLLIRDGGVRLFNHSIALEAVKPMQGVKAFLQQYMETVAPRLQRHVSTIDNDHPPSPTGVDPIDLFAKQLQSPARRPPASPQIAMSPNLMSPSPGYGQSPAPAGASSSTASEGRRLPSGVSWAGGAATLLSLESFLRLLSPGGALRSACSPLELFMASSMLRSHLARAVASDKNSLQMLRSDQPDALSFRSEALYFIVQLQRPALHSLCIESFHVSETYRELFSAEDLATLNKYFEYKVSSAPHRPVHIDAWTTLLSVQPRVLKDIIEILKTELGQKRELTQRWQVALCLSRPHDLPPDVSGVPPGPAVVLAGPKLLLILKLSLSAQLQSPSAAPPVVIPLIHQIEDHVTRVPEPQRSSNQPLTTTLQVVKNVLRRYSAEFRHQQCTLFSAVRELLLELQPPYSPQ